MQQYEARLTELSQVITQFPNDARALAHRGEVYCLIGRPAESLADLDRALRLKPDYFWALARRGETFRIQKQFEQALIDFDHAIELSPTYSWALAHRGATYRLMGCHEKALHDLSRALDLDHRYAWTLVHRADVYVATRQYDKALADADAAIGIDAAIIPYWQGERGLILNFLGRYVETVVGCEQALQQDPNDFIAFYSLIVALVCSRGLAASQSQLNKAQIRLIAAEQTEHTRSAALYRLGGLAALQQYNDQALCYLRDATLLDDEPREMARHDPAWHNLWNDPLFQLLTESNI